MPRQRTLAVAQQILPSRTRHQFSYFRLGKCDVILQYQAPERSEGYDACDQIPYNLHFYGAYVLSVYTNTIWNL